MRRALLISLLLQLVLLPGCVNGCPRGSPPPEPRGPFHDLPICSIQSQVHCNSSYCIDPEKKLYRGTVDSMPVSRSKVLCDGKTDGGGWVVFQRRWKDNVDFNRGWEYYKNGFGCIDGDYWWGNENLHLYTNDRTCELHVIMITKEGRYDERYTKFRIDSEGPGYTLYYDTRIEEIGLRKKDGLKISNTNTFSTKDKGWDLNCAQKEGGGFWYLDYHTCANAKLNSKNMSWVRSEVKYSQMMVRCFPDHGPIPGLPICGLQFQYDCTRHSSCIDTEKKLYRGTDEHWLPFSRSEVLCDGKIDGGGWVVFQRRWENKLDFNRDWEQYKNGFGRIDGEFWWGNENLYLYTRGRTCELYITIISREGERFDERYTEFWIGSENGGYTLYFDKRIEETGLKNTDPLEISNTNTFSTNDKGWDMQHCAKRKKGGWWYYKPGDCADGVLNVEEPYWGDSLVEYSQMMVRCFPDHGPILGLPHCKIEAQYDCTKTSCIDGIVGKLYRGTVDKLPISRSEVLCDGISQGGGWVVFQRRWKHTLDFNRGWTQYANGFGKGDDEFWWGNENLHLFTRQRYCDLYIIMMTNGNREIEEQFYNFWIDSQANGYALHYDTRAGIQNDLHITIEDPLAISNGETFSTSDNGFDWEVCAKKKLWGWWYQDSRWCAHGNLNSEIMTWGQHGKGHLVVRSSQMMVRCH